MDSQLFDQLLEDCWSAEQYDSKPAYTGADLCPNYKWFNQYNPLPFDFEDLQSFGDLESCNISTSTSPLEFALPSPISDASHTPEDRFDQKSFIDQWLIPTAFENNTTIPAAPCNSLNLSPPSLASSPSSSESNSPWDVDRDVETKKSKPTVTMRTGKGRNQSCETSRGKSASPIGKQRQMNSHNQIEKRYRNNLNCKINALRDSIPSLRFAAKEEEGEDAMDSDAGERSKLRKCNKGTILEKAIQYIVELEKEGQRLQKENSRLQMIVKGNMPSYLMLGLNKAIAYT